MIQYLLFDTSKLLNISDITKRIGSFFKLPIQLFYGVPYPELAFSGNSASGEFIKEYLRTSSSCHRISMSPPHPTARTGTGYGYNHRGHSQLPGLAVQIMKARRRDGAGLPEVCLVL